jgi:UTP--glucose-1-phosphate uridylyltransferase
VTKAVIPAAGLGTRFLPATKAQPKEMLPVVDKPAIQYVVEEAVRAGIEDICLVTSSSKRSLEDHFDRNFELEQLLASKGKQAELDEIVALADLADFHFVRQGEPLGLGHAVSVARRHVGDNPFVVLLGDEFMSEESALLEGMIAAHEEHGCSVLALMEVEGDEIARYGSADAEPMSGRLVKVNGVVEKPKPAEAPSNLAVMGRYVLTPQIFEHIANLQPGAGGELQLTDAIGTLLTEQTVLGYTFSEGRYDTGQVLDYLKVIVELAAGRDDLGPPFRQFLKDFVART